MYSKTTKKINITVNQFYLEDQSEPNNNHYVWAYKVTINNNGKETVQLKNRYWKIIDSNGIEQEVRGEGVVGELLHHAPPEISAGSRRANHPGLPRQALQVARRAMHPGRILRIHCERRDGSHRPCGRGSCQGPGELAE